MARTRAETVHLLYAGRVRHDPSESTPHAIHVLHGQGDTLHMPRWEPSCFLPRDYPHSPLEQQPTQGIPNNR